MKILGINSQTVELRITNYQFPQTPDRDYDGNWLNIYLDVDSELGKWQTTDPSLLTWEVEELINWFLTLSNNGEPEYRHLEFIEPNLSFELLNYPTDPVKQIKLEFQLESRQRSANEEDEYFVVFEVNKKNLKQLANDLTSQLKKYPMRK
ncbi:MAG: hypothetical protein R8G66_21655 [Cytophagales bacterium]|nr:hypothetical protein [Cytophagales bacterium]